MADFGSLYPEEMPAQQGQGPDPTADILRRLLFMRSGQVQAPPDTPEMTRALPGYEQRSPNELAALRTRRGVESPARTLAPMPPSMTASETGEAVYNHPEAAVSMFGLPGQIVGAAMANTSDRSDARGMSPMGAPRQRAPIDAPAGLSLDQLMGQKQSLNEQRASLDRQRATAVADRDMELRGGKDASGRVVQGGRGKNYGAKEAEVARLTDEMTALDSGMSRLDGMITEANKRLSPEYQMNQQKAREAEGVREQMLSEARKPFHEEFPGWSKVQAFAPAAAGALTMGAQATINALRNRFKVGKWEEAIKAANSPKASAARTRGADVSEGYNTNVFPREASAIKPYGAAATLGGAEGAMLANAPEAYNLFLPPLNQERQAYEEYLKRLPADHPERARIEEMIAKMPAKNPYREAAVDHFASPAVAVRTLVGGMEGAGGALAGKTVGGLLEPSLPRAEADALAKSVREAAEKAAKKKPASAPRQIAAPAPGSPPLTVDAVRARNGVPYGMLNVP